MVDALNYFAILNGTRSDDIIIFPHANGLGDQLIYSTLPELFARAGRRVFISCVPGFRNEQIRQLVWEYNPFVSGFSADPPNAGAVNPIIQKKKFLNLVRRFPGMIAAMEALHGFSAPFGRHPRIYYQARFQPRFSNAIVVDCRSHSTCFPDETVNAYVRNLAGQLEFRPDEVVRLVSRWSGPNGSSALENTAVHQVEDIFEYADVMYSSKMVLCVDSGGAALASAVKGENAFPRVFVLVKALTWNHNDWIYPNLEYFVSSADGTDY